MHKDQKATFRSAIMKADDACQKVEAIRDLMEDMRRKLVMIQTDASSARTDLLKLYAELTSKEEQ